MIEWKIGDEGWDDSGVAKLSTPKKAYPVSHSTVESLPSWRRLIITSGIVMALIVAGFAVLKWRAQRVNTAVRAEVQSVLDQEVWALENGNWELYESLLDQQVPASWYRQQHRRFLRNAQRGQISAKVTNLALFRPELALAEVRITLPSGRTHRETQAFRQVSNTWRRSATPISDLWIHQVQRETANLRFIFHRDDVQRLEPLFPAIQELYTQLLDDFGLSPLPNRRELRIVLSVQPTDIAFTGGDRLYDLSSLAATSDTEQIKRELGTRLVGDVLHQFYADAGEMSFILDAIHDWEVSTWMGETEPVSGTDIIEALRRKPFLPLLMVHPQTPPANLDQQAAETLAETVIEYFAWRNGRGAVKALIAGVRRYDDWPHLIEDGLGLSYRDIDHGWWYYVATHYGSSKDRSDDQVRADLTWVLQLEREAVEARNQQLFESLLDPHAPSEWENKELSRYWRSSGEQAVPELVEIGDWGYAEDTAWTILRRADTENNQSTGGYWTSAPLRTYHFVNRRWYLTSPATAFTDPPLAVRTNHFEFRYREPDAGKLPAFTSGVDALYEQLAHDFGISAEAPSPIRVELLYAKDPIRYGICGKNNVCLPSPQLLSPDLRAQNIEPGEATRANLGYMLCDMLLSEVIDLPGRQRNNSLLYGILIWEAEKWGKIPYWTEDKQEAVQHSLKHNTLPPLSGNPSILDSEAIRMRHYTNVTIAEYVAETYGRHRFADIISAAEEHSDLQDLIPAALGVDIEFFEAGWRSYLRETYSTDHDQ